jgi:predicted SnoaL-like aldol condensation-catalyzing enzyme
MTTSDTVATNKALVLKAITGVFVDRNPAVLDELFSPDYRQHNPQIPNGIEAFKGRLGQLPESFDYQAGLVMADGDYVAVHGRYVGWAAKPMVAIDIFRVANGKVAEHWDVMQEEVPATEAVNGNPMFPIGRP